MKQSKPLFYVILSILATLTIFILIGCGSGSTSDGGATTGSVKSNEYGYKSFTDNLKSKNSLSLSLPSDLINDKNFSVEYRSIIINGNNLKAYEYKNTENLNDELAKITEKGKTINGNAITFDTEPHYFKKERLLVLYDGNNSSTLQVLREFLGTELF